MIRSVTGSDRPCVEDSFPRHWKPFTHNMKITFSVSVIFAWPDVELSGELSNRAGSKARRTALAALVTKAASQKGRRFCSGTHLCPLTISSRRQQIPYRLSDFTTHANSAWREVIARTSLRHGALAVDIRRSGVVTDWIARNELEAGLQITA